MPKILQSELARLPLRVHDFLSDVPLHDAWAVDLPKRRSGVTLDTFLRQTKGRLFSESPIVRALVSIRLCVGSVFGWDQTPPGDAAETFADRLTDDDRARTLEAVGTPQTPNSIFRVVYRFENEQLTEFINRTAHAGALSALFENQSGYRFYFAVYVRAVSRLTPLYMALIDPFRNLIVYPSLLRSVQANWERTAGSE
jgi:Protein of unknown function (DUF2867)